MTTMSLLREVLDKWEQVSDRPTHLYECTVEHFIVVVVELGSDPPRIEALESMINGVRPAGVPVQFYAIHHPHQTKAFDAAVRLAGLRSAVENFFPTGDQHERRI